MAQPNPITTGEQTVTTTGALTGSLSTNGLPRTGELIIRVRGLTGSQTIRVAIEDTANSSAFSDATTCAVFDFQGAQPNDGDTRSIELGKLPSMRFGSTNNALRGNCTAISGSTSASVEVELAQ